MAIPHLSLKLSPEEQALLRIILAERTGFEPADVSVSGFQDQRLQPLGHLSAVYYNIYLVQTLDEV